MEVLFAYRVTRTYLKTRRLVYRLGKNPVPLCPFFLCFHSWLKPKPFKVRKGPYEWIRVDQVLTNNKAVTRNFLSSRLCLSNLISWDGHLLLQSRPAKPEYGLLNLIKYNRFLKNSSL